MTWRLLYYTRLCTVLLLLVPLLGNVLHYCNKQIRLNIKGSISDYLACFYAIHVFVNCCFYLFLLLEIYYISCH